MSRRKEKKIKKLKNKKIWPHVVAVIIVAGIFLTISMIGVELSIGSVYMSKAASNYKVSLDVKKMYEERMNSQDSTEDIFDEIIEQFSTVENIGITGENGVLMSAYGGEESSLEMEVNIPENDESEEDITAILADELDYKKMVDSLFKQDWDSNEEVDILQVVDSVGIWYNFPLSDGENTLCIKTKVDIYISDLAVIIAGFCVNALLAVLIILWNIVYIIRLIKEQRKLTKVFYTDMVSGGNNMHYFYDKAKKILRKNRRKKLKSVIIDMRVRKYRSFCACYGVEEGMELIEKLYNAISSHIQKNEILAHTEHADFALLLNYETEESLVERLQEMSEDLKMVYPGQKLDFSIGIYKIDKNNPEFSDASYQKQHQHGVDDIECMYNFAGLALASILEDSEKRICWYNDEMRQNQMWERIVENDMQRALDNKEFQVYLQPKYSTKDEKLSGAEALVRWLHPDKGLLSPYKFIPIFEKNGFILKLDDYMITEVARQQAKWIAAGKKVVPISVNVSRAHFTQNHLAEHICKLIDQFHIPHDVIELELTESAFFDDKQILINTVKKLQDYGFDVSMDDFGAGYSSLNSLKELPLDVLKLDAEFFRGDDNEGRGELIIGETITLAKKLDMRIVAEGIETREQVDSLADKDCDLIQGYYFAKPMPISEFEERAFGA